MTFGDAGRELASTLDISTMRANNQTLVGYFLGAELFMAPEPTTWSPAFWPTLPPATCVWSSTAGFPLEQAGEAHAYIESRQAFGRVLLIP